MTRGTRIAVRTSLLMMLALICARAPDHGIFRDLPLDAALALAKKDQKIVMIDFFTTWCGPCKKLDTTTWKDAAVLEWAAQKCVALKVDAEKDVALAKRFKISAYPTIVLLKDDGSEIDRLVGYKDARTFLSDVASALNGETSVDRAKEALVGHEEKPMARERHATELMRKGRFEEALTEYLWCFDHGDKDPGYGAVRRSFLLSYIAQLGRQYPPAIKALEERLDAAESRLIAGSDSYDDWADASALNRTLKTPERLLALYDRLRKDRPLSSSLRSAVQRQLFEPLAEAKRYADLIDLVEDSDAYVRKQIEHFEATRRFGRDQAEDEEQKQASESMNARLKDMVVNESCILHHALLMTGRTEVADDVAHRLMVFAPKGSTYTALIASAVQAGSVDTARSIGEIGVSVLPESEQKKVLKALDGLPKSKK